MRSVREVGRAAPKAGATGKRGFLMQMEKTVADGRVDGGWGHTKLEMPVRHPVSNEVRGPGNRGWRVGFHLWELFTRGRPWKP